MAFSGFLHQQSWCVNMEHGAMDRPAVETHLAADHGEVSVAVGTVVTAREERVVQHISPGGDKVQLVPMLGYVMSSGHSVV